MIPGRIGLIGTAVDITNSDRHTDYDCDCNLIVQID
jgi:hypothetical protein